MDVLAVIVRDTRPRVRRVGRLGSDQEQHGDRRIGLVLREILVVGQLCVPNPGDPVPGANPVPVAATLMDNSIANIIDEREQISTLYHIAIIKL